MCASSRRFAVCLTCASLWSKASSFLVPVSSTISSRNPATRSTGSDEVNGFEKVPPSLFESIRLEDDAGVTTYIDAGYDCNVADALGEPAVNQAAKLGNLSMVKALVEAGANPNHGSFNGGDTALMQAASQGHLSVVKYLVEQAKADVNKTNNIGDTALSVACFWGRVPVVKYLLEVGADTQLYNDNNKLAGEEFDILFETDGASEVKQLLHDYRASKGLLAQEEKNPLLWYLDEDKQ